MPAASNRPGRGGSKVGSAVVTLGLPRPILFAPDQKHREVDFRIVATGVLPALGIAQETQESPHMTGPLASAMDLQRKIARQVARLGHAARENGAREKERRQRQHDFAED